MGDCAGKPINKVTPPLSNGELVDNERQVGRSSKNDENTKDRNGVISINRGVINERSLYVDEVENNDKNPEEKPVKTGLDLPSSSNTNMLGRHAVVGNQHESSEQNYIGISSTEQDLALSSMDNVRQEDSGHSIIQDSASIKPYAPRKAVRFEINFVDTEINSQALPGRFPRRLKVNNNHTKQITGLNLIVNLIFIYFFIFRKKLEGMPQLTAEQLRRKQEIVEQNRANVRMN